MSIRRAFVRLQGVTATWFQRVCAFFVRNQEAIRQLEQEAAHLRRTEQALSASEKRYRLLAEYATDVLWVLDTETLRFCLVSPAVEQLRGLSVAEVLSQGAEAAFSPTSWIQMQQLLPERLARFRSGQRESYVDEVEQPCRDGSTVWTEATTRFVRNEENGHVEVYGVSRHITGRRLIEQQLRKLWRAIEQSPASIVITDTTGAIEYVNPKFTQVTGYAAEEVIGQNPRFLKTGYTAPHVYQEMWLAITSGREWRGTFCNRRKSGGLYWEAASLSPVMDSAGVVTHFVAVKEDITEQRRMEEALRQVAAALDARNKELDSFAHTVAHDLKGPVSTIIGFADFLHNCYTTLSPASLEQSLLDMRRSALKLHTIIEELMLLTGVRDQEVAPQPLHMGSIVQEALLRQDGLGDKIPAQVLAPDESVWPVALGHAPWVEEVWVNYLSNAVKYGGRPLHIELGATPQADGKARFWVRDNGPGIKPEDRAKLFVPYTQLNYARGIGHGLGLSIVRRIVEKLGGEVGVESTPEQGATFYFTLPLASSAVSHSIN